MTGGPVNNTGSWSGTRRSFPRRVRLRILDRDRWTCVTCGAPATIADHIVPVAEGGSDTADNGQSLCDNCHGPKTRGEARRGRMRRSRSRPVTGTHPGLL